MDNVISNILKSNQIDIFQILENNKEVSREVWKDIPGYKGLYQASNKGKIRSVDRQVKTSEKHKRKIKGKELKLYNNNGYLKTQLSKDGIRVNEWVHRLIAKTYISNPDFKPQVSHKDGNKSNNKVDNLFWATEEESLKNYFKNKDER